MFLEISKQWFLALYFSPSCGEYYNSTSIFLVSLWKFSKVQIPLYNYKFFILILLKMSFFFFNSQKAYFRKHNQVRHIKLLLKKKIKKKKALCFKNWDLSRRKTTSAACILLGLLENRIAGKPLHCLIPLTFPLIYENYIH